MIKIDHIGIAVKDMKTSISLFETLMSSDCYKVEVVESERVTTAFLQKGETKVELLESADNDGVIARFIDKKGEGLHHIAFEVEDIYVEMERLRKDGFILLSDQPKAGADNKLVCFVHPKTTNGVLIEICQQIH